MKTKIPTVAFSAFALGTFFKMEHWPGANILLLLSALLIISSTLIEFTQLEKDTKIRGLQIVVAIMVIACSVAAVFKIFHWPGGNFLVNIAMNVSIPAAIVFFFFSNVEYRLSRNLVAGIFYLLLLLMIFFPGNPIGDRANQTHQENTTEQQNTPNEPAH
jgi:glucan phosphoethanolaminetransferase (alkaline phosphatase superfamily)